MPPRIAYWTSGFEPEMEAISSEVTLLRRHFPSSVAWGLSHRHWLLCSWRRGFCLNPKMHLFFRMATRVLESAFQINHIVGSLGDWFYLAGKRRRPTVLTLAAHNDPVDQALLDRVDQFVVECPDGFAEVSRLGFASGRVRMILPPVNLERFVMKAPLADQVFTVLFASSPDQQDWLAARGIPQLLDAAALRPNMRFRLLWRPWGDSAAPVAKAIAERSLNNVDLDVNRATDMVAEYHSAHVIVLAATDPKRTKPAPNSIIESMACGRPVVVTESIGLASMIRDAGAGIVCQATGDSIADALDRIKGDWLSYSIAARQLAERHFDEKHFLSKYDRLYSEILAGAVN